MKWSILPCIMMEESSLSPQRSKQPRKADTHVLLSLSFSLSILEIFGPIRKTLLRIVIQRLKSARASERSEVMSSVVREWKRRRGEWVHCDLGLLCSRGHWFLGFGLRRRGERGQPYHCTRLSSWLIRRTFLWGSRSVTSWRNTTLQGVTQRARRPHLMSRKQCVRWGFTTPSVLVSLWEWM